MPTVTAKNLPKFTEEEVSMCLQEAAATRSCYLGPKDGQYDQLDLAKVKEAKFWDDLAEKIAGTAGLKVEQECSFCEDGTAPPFGICLYCLGTELLPPTKNGKRVYPELRK